MQSVKSTIVCFACVLLSIFSFAQELNLVSAQWEIRNKDNDPNIESDSYCKLRIKFKTATFISFTGLKGSNYPSTLLLELAYKPSGFYVLPLYVQVNKDGQWERYTVDLQRSNWDEVLTKNSDVIKKIFDDFKTGSKARVRIGYNGEDWYEFSLASFKASSAKIFSAAKSPVSEPKTTRDKYGFPLLFGDKKNKYVEAIQRELLQEKDWTGNYDQKTKQAIAKYVEQYKESLDAEEIPYKLDGDYMSIGLYNDILERGDKNELQKKVSESTSSSTESQSQPQPSHTQTTYKGSVVIRFPIHSGFGTASEEEGYMLYDLQNSVGAKPTKELDDQTFSKVKEFVSSEENKKLFGIDAPDSRDLSVLNNTVNPGITQRLYNIIVDTANKKDKNVVK